MKLDTNTILSVTAVEKIHAAAEGSSKRFKPAIEALAKML